MRRLLEPGRRSKDPATALQSGWQRPCLKKREKKKKKKGGESGSTSLRKEYLEFFSVGDLSTLPIHLFLQVLMSAWTHGYLFYTLGYNWISLYLFCSLNCSNFRHSVSGSFCVSCMCSHHCGVLSCFCIFPYFLVRQESLILHIPCPSARGRNKQPNLSNKPWLLLLEKGIRKLELTLDVLTATRGLLLTGPLGGQSKEICMCNNPCVYISL